MNTRALLRHMTLKERARAHRGGSLSRKVQLRNATEEQQLENVDDPVPRDKGARLDAWRRGGK